MKRDRGKQDPGLPVRKPRQEVMIQEGRTPEETERNVATFLTSPELAAYRVVKGAEAKSVVELIDVPGLMSRLREQGEAVNNGDLRYAESMLMNQATALQSLFARLTERAMAMKLLPQFETFMRMALRAQSQCRATLETLATIKNPPMVFAKQANVTTGPQQVNNGLSVPRAGNPESEQSRLLEASDVERMDTGTAGAASGGDQALATMGAVHGTEDRRG